MQNYVKNTEKPHNNFLLSGSFKKPGTVLCAAIILALYFYLTIPGAGRSMFWSDEAYTATRALNILETGLPYVTFGPNLAVNGPHDYNFLKLEAGHGWLSHYLTALSFALFGRSETAGRIPFILAGAATILLTIILGCALYGNLAGLFAGLILAVHPAFIKHCVQCRYYALSMFFSVALVGVYVLWKRKGTAKNGLFFAGVTFALFMSFQMFAFVLFGAIFIYDLLSQRQVKISDRLEKWIKPTLVTSVLVVPWTIFFMIGRDLPDTGFPLASPGEWFEQAGIAFGKSLWFFPLIFLIGLLPCDRKKTSYLPVGIAAAAIFLICMIPKELFIGYKEINDRYILFLLPICALICARTTVLFRNKKALITIAVVVIIGTAPALWGKTNLLGKTAKDFRYWSESFVELNNFYQGGFSPDPAKAALEKVRALSKEGSDIHVQIFDPVLLMYYLGNEKRIAPCCDLVEESTGDYLIVGQAAEFEKKPSALFENCQKKSWPHIGFFILNHAESYRFDQINEERSRLLFQILECNNGDITNLVLVK